MTTSQRKGRLFVDCQVFQYTTWDRGMGRYTLKLLEALSKTPVELTLIFNKNITLEQSRLKAVMKACTSADVLYLKLSDNPNGYGGWKRLQEVCALELDRQLKGTIKPQDTYLIASNFALRYCSVFPNIACRKALIFYDLTPYLHWKDYKLTPDFEPKKYFAQFATLFRADQLWAISQSAADEIKNWLGVDARKVQNIRGASIRNLDEKIRKPAGIGNSRFLLCPSADGPHKNNENMVRAFNEFNKQNGEKYKLVITSGFSDQSKATLGAISSDIIFTGHVSDGELSWLYSHCEALLFVSKTEGLGLPVLEAVGAAKKVICSDIQVFREISEEAFYLADPYEIESITAALYSALVLADHWVAKKKHYPEIEHTFSWEAAAKTCIKLMDNPVVGSYPVISKPHQAIWFADADGPSLARDIAEVLYPSHQAIDFCAMRRPKYLHNSPSYLIEVGVAATALEGYKVPAGVHVVYIVDDSEEGAMLLLCTLGTPGLVVAAFQHARPPKNIARYLKSSFGASLTYKKLMKLVDLTGNQTMYETDFSVRGTEQFIHQVTSLGAAIIREEGPVEKSLH